MSSSTTIRPAMRRTSLLVAFAFALTSVATLAHPAPTLAWDAGAYSSGSEQDLVALTNRSRAAAGLKALKVSSTLTSVARWRSKDMIERDYFSHDIPGYGSGVVIMFASPDEAEAALDGIRSILGTHGGRAWTHGDVIIGFTERPASSRRGALDPCV